MQSIQISPTNPNVAAGTSLQLAATALLGRRNQGGGERGTLRLNGTPVIPRCNDAFVFGQIDVGKILGIGHR